MKISDNQNLDELLDQLGNRQVPAPPHLAGRIVAGVTPRDPVQEVLGWFTNSVWRGAATALLPVVLGFGLGFAGVLETPLDESAYSLETLVYLDGFEESGSDEF